MPERVAAVADRAPARPAPRQLQVPPRAVKQPPASRPLKPKPPPRGRILGFDYGRKRIGVAVGNTQTATAQPLNSVAAFDGEPDWPQLQQFVDAWRPAVLAVGLPLHMNGDLSGMARIARAFGRRAAARFDLPVVFIDERLTTREAEEYLQLAIAESKRAKRAKTGRRASAKTVDSTATGKKLAALRQKNRDCIAAQLIVQACINRFAESAARAPAAMPDVPGLRDV